MRVVAGRGELGWGGCHTRHGERIHFRWPWVFAEAPPGGLITHRGPGARGGVRRSPGHTHYARTVV